MKPAKGSDRFWKFKNPYFGIVERDSIPAIVDRLFGKSGWSLMVGTDSHVRDGVVTFATAFVVHKVHIGGTYFYVVKHEDSRYFDFYSRIYREVELSIELARVLSDLFETRDIEIHIDAGNDGMTSKILPGLVGYVIGEGFTPVAKPYSFVASKVADKHSK